MDDSVSHSISHYSSTEMELLSDNFVHTQLPLALAELEANSSAFKRQRNIDGIALLKRQIEIQLESDPSLLPRNGSDSFPLKIRCCGGCGFSTGLQVNASDSIESVKFQMWQMEGIPPHQQRLLCGELELGDDRTLIDYNINSESELRMVLHLRGYNTQLELCYQQLGQVNYFFR